MNDGDPAIVSEDQNCDIVGVKQYDQARAVKDVETAVIEPIHYR